MALISGEISTTTYVDIPKVVRETIKDIGYTRAKYGYDSQTMAVLTAIDEQSPDIAQGVTKLLSIEMIFLKKKLKQQVQVTKD